jgi:hypothetical protein
MRRNQNAGQKAFSKHRLLGVSPPRRQHLTEDTVISIAAANAMRCIFCTPVRCRKLNSMLAVKKERLVGSRVPARTFKKNFIV